MRGARRLSNQCIESARAEPNDVWLSDNDGSRGPGRLMVRVGRRTRLFYFKYSRDGKVHRVWIGRYSRTKLDGFLTLDEARIMARRASLALCDRTIIDIQAAIGVRSPLSRARGRPVAVATPICSASIGAPCAGPGIVWLCEMYVDYLRTRGTPGSDVSARLYSYDIKNYIQGTRWANIDARAMTGEDAVSLIKVVAERKSKHKADRIRGLLSAAFGYAIRAKTSASAPESLSKLGIASNPINATLRLGNENLPLDRVLSDAELGHFWNELTTGAEARTMNYRFVRVTILLGGQRCAQLLRTRPADVNEDDEVLRLADGKGNRKIPHLSYLPLLPLAKREILELLNECSVDGRSYLFGDTYRKESHTSAEGVSRAVSNISARLVRTKKINHPFSYRDIRRTIETRMSKLKIPKEHRAHIQSHDLGGVQNKFYNRYDFHDEMREALGIWERHVIDCAAAVRTAAIPR